MEGRLRRGLDVGDLTEDTDHALALEEADRADLDRDAIAVVADHDDRALDVLAAHHVPGERLLRAPRVFRGHDGRDLAAANIPHQAFRGFVQPADDPVLVVGVARNADALERVGDVTPECLQTRHALESARALDPGSSSGLDDLHKIERRIEVFPQPIEAGDAQSAAVFTVQARGDDCRVDRPACREEPSAADGGLTTHTKCACGALRQSAPPAWRTYSWPSTSNRIAHADSASTQASAVRRSSARSCGSLRSTAVITLTAPCSSSETIHRGERERASRIAAASSATSKWTESASALISGSRPRPGAGGPGGRPGSARAPTPGLRSSAPSRAGSAHPRLP